MKRRRGRAAGCLALSLGLAVALCVLAPLALFTAGMRAASNDSDTTVLNACVTASFHARPQVSLSWRLSPSSQAVHATWVRNYLGYFCGNIPRLAFVPTRGLLRIPSSDSDVLFAVGWPGD